MSIDHFTSTANMRRKRRLILKSSLGFASLAVLGSAAVLSPRIARAAWEREAFTEPNMADAVQLALGKDKGIRSNDIFVDAPDYIKRPSLVDVPVLTTLPKANSIAILISENPPPLAALYSLPEGTEPFVTARLDIHRSTEVIAVVRSGRKLYSSFRQIIIRDDLEYSFDTLDDYSLELDADLLELLE